MKGLHNKIKYDRYKVKATSEGVTRTEVVSTKNPIFEGALTKTGIRRRYEAYWNINPREPRVKVLNVTKVRKRRRQSSEDYIGF